MPQILWNPLTSRPDMVGTSGGGGGGTVTSVSEGAGIQATPNPIVGAGSIALDIASLTAESTLAAGDLFAFVDVSEGTDPGDQRSVEFSDILAAITTGLSGVFQPLDAGLTALSSLGAGIAVSDGADGWFARSLAVTDSSSVDFTLTNANGVAGNPTITAVVLPAGVDHNLLANLAVGDVHTQYLLLAGRAGTANDPLISTGAIGTITGSDDASGVLALLGSSNATKGPVRVNDVTFTHSGTLGMLQIGGTITAAGGTLNYLEIAQITGTPRVVSLSGGIIGRAVIFQPSVRNSTVGVANDLGAWILFGNAAQFRTNNTTGTTVAEVRTFADSPTFNQITGGTLAVAILTSLDCRPTISTGATVALRRGVRFLDKQGAGGVQTDVIGFDYETQTAAGLNFAFRNQDVNATLTSAGFFEGIAGTGNPLLLRSNSLNDGQIRLGGVESDAANVVVNGSTADITFEGPTLVKSFLTIHDSKSTTGAYGSTNAATVLLKKYSSAVATAAPRVYFARSRGTQGTPTAILNDDCLGRIDFLGFGGTIYRRAARIVAEVDDMAPDDTQIGGLLRFQTAPAPGALADRLVIDAAGYSQFSGSVGIRALVYTWPAAHVAGSLRNDGAGVLSWSAAAVPGTIIVQEDDVTVDAAATTLDFTEPDDVVSVVTSSPAGEANVDLGQYWLRTGRPTGRNTYLLSSDTSTPRVSGGAAGGQVLELEGTNSATRGRVDIRDSLKVFTSPASPVATTENFIAQDTAFTTPTGHVATRWLNFAPTVTLGDNIGTVAVLRWVPTITAASNAVITMGTWSGGQYSPTFTPVGASGSFTGLILRGMVAGPTFTNAGTANTITRFYLGETAGTINANWTATDWGGLLVSDPGGAGTITNLYGVNVAALTSHSSTIVAAFNSAVAAAATNFFLRDTGGAQSSLVGKFTTYNNVATEGFGLATLVDEVAITGRTTAIGSTNFTNANVAGLYRVHYYMVVTTTAAVPTMTTTIGWTDNSAARTSVSAVMAFAATNFVSGTVYVRLNSGNVTYLTTLTGAIGTGVYAYYATCERLV